MSKEIAVKDAVLEVLEDPKNAKLSPMKVVYAGIGLIVTKLASFSIKTPEDYDAAMVALKSAKDVIGEADKAYEKAVGVEEGLVKRAKDAYKLLTNPVNIGMADLKNRMGKFQNDQDAKRRAEADKLRLQQIEAQRKMEAADTVKDQQKIANKMEKTEAKIEAVTTYKPKTVDMERKMEVLDPSKVDRKYCEPVDKLIRKDLGKVGDPIPEIAGVRIWDAPKIVIR